MTEVHRIGASLATAVVFLLAAARAESQAVTTGQVSYWPMDTVAGTTTDAVGTNPFTVVNGAVAAPGFVGGAVRLDGTNDHLTAADAASLDFGAGSFTVGAWVRPTTTTNRRLLNKWDGPAQQGWLLDIHTGSGGGAAVGTIRLRLDSNAAGNTAGTDTVDFLFAAGLDSGNWRHIAVVVDRTGNMVRCYLDGAAVGAGIAIPASLGSLDNTFQLGLGTIPTALGAYFAGDVDEVRLYNRALSAAEVLTLVAPVAPVLAGPPLADNNQVTLTWAAVPGAVDYQVYYSTTSGSGYVAFGGPVTGTSATVTGLTNGVPYFFVVTANNGVADSLNSNQVTGTPVQPPPRLSDHDEGTFGDKCSCGATASGPASALLLLAALAALLLFHRS